MTEPARTPPWMEAPTATASSGLTPLEGSRPKTALTVSTTRGMRDMPPTRMTSLISLALTPASEMAFLQGSTVWEMSLETSCSSCERDIFMLTCLGPEASAVM